MAGGHLAASDASSVTITWADFEGALEELKPAFGADDLALGSCLAGGMFDYGPRYQELRGELGRFVSQVTVEISMW